MAPVEQGALHVEVVYCPLPGRCDLVRLSLPAGATAGDALQASGLVQRHALVPHELRLGVWCKVREPAHPLRDRDRVEVYRALIVDPKEARRLRYKRHLDAKRVRGA